MNMEKRSFWSLMVLVALFWGCNDYEYTPVTITLTNQSNEPVYLWVERFEEINATTLVPGKKSRTFYQVFTFTDEHPQTHLTVVATKNNDVAGAATILVNPDTTTFTAVYNTGAGISITQKE